MGASEKKPVVFRRIRGRIVPIRIKKDHVFGGGVAMTGLGGAGAIGYASGGMSRTSRVRARTGMIFSKMDSAFGPDPLAGAWSKDYAKILRKSQRRLKMKSRQTKGFFREATKFRKLSRIGLGAGLVLGTSVVASGIDRASGKHQDNTFVDNSVAFSATAAALGVGYVAGSRPNMKLKKIGKFGFKVAKRIIRRR